jgi:hypothetical protein
MWRDHVSLMQELKIEERSVPSIDLDVDDVALDGPVDVALCVVARAERVSHHEVLVLTNERNLTRWMKRSESQVKTLLQVLDEIRSA